MIDVRNPVSDDMAGVTPLKPFKPLILVVDDEERDLALLEALLEREGYRTRRALDGKAALEAAEAEPPDVILLDVMMPGMDGCEVARALKASPVTKAVPIVIITVLDDHESRLRGLEAGAEEFVTKPVDHNELRIRVRNLLRLKEYGDFLANHNRILEAQVTACTAELRESEERFRSSMHHSAIGMALVAPDGRWLEVNEALCRIVGYSSDQLLATNFQSITHPDDLDADLEYVHAMLERRIETYQMEKRYLHKAGHIVWILLSVSLVWDADGAPKYFISQIQDITERKEQELRIKRLNRILTVLSGINSAIVRIRDRGELFRETCRIAVEHGGFGIAWIGKFDAETLEVTPVASAGLDENDPLRIGKFVVRSDTPHGQGTVAVAIRERRPVYNNNITADSGAGGERRREAIRRGYRSVITLPLMADNVVVASFTMFVKEPDFFDEDEVKLLTGLAGDISFALDHIARQQKLEKLSRIRAVSSEINAAIVRIRERKTLLSETCRIAAEHGKFELVWIGSLDLEKQEVRPVAWTGFSPEAANAVSWASISAAQGTLAEAIRTRRPAVCNDIEAEWVTGKLRQEALKVGCRSTVCLPLVVDDNVVALIALFATGRGFFDEDELALLNELAADVSFALDHLDKAARLDYLAYYDSLTGVPNRTLFRNRLELALAHARRRSEMLGVILINLDRFEKINESLGTDAGDELLRKVASRLQASLREVDTIARLGGNEFAVVAEGVTTGAEVIAVADKLTQALAAPFDVRGHEVFVSASTGVAVYPTGATDPQVLVRNAESAMRRVKQEGGGGYQLYDEQPTPQRTHRLELESRLRHAVERNELAVHYQPKVNLLTGAITGAEALLRWNHPELGLISPAQFIPIAEETGLIIPIGAWVLRAACAQTAAWHRADYPIEIAVNLSPRQFRDKNLVNTVAAALTESGLAAEYLELEITEGTAMSHAEHTVTVLGELHALDVKLAVDDFGTGYSSLSYLKRFPLDCLKIDRSFVSDIGSDPNSEAIVPATVALAHSLQLKVVAEGIETEVQRDFLASAGCDEGQGYLYSRPLPAAEFGALLGAARNTPLAWGA